MEKKKNVIILTGNKYPDGDAGALRQHTMGKMFHSLGYNVMVYGMGNTTSGAIKMLDGISYRSMRNNRRNIIGRLLDRVTWGDKAVEDIKKRFDSITAILIVDDNPILFKKVERLADRYKCCLIHDSVEWYSPEEFKTGKFNIQYLLKNHINTLAISKKWSVIAISTYLYDWFKDRAKRVVLIPVILDMNYEEHNNTVSTDANRICFVYAGAPGKKDYLKELIKGFSLLSEQQKEKIELHVIGVTNEQLLNQCGVDEVDVQALGSCFTAHGRVPHDEALEWVSKANYTLLLRNSDLRYAKAGFPTKIVESLKYGTPPMCNMSSDLANYLDDHRNALIIEACTAEAVKKAAEKAISISSEEYAEIRRNARITAREKFDYQKYVRTLDSLLQ